MGLIYLITNPTGKLYVGMTTLSMSGRKKSHKHAASHGVKSILYSSIRKHGWDNHIFSILEKADDKILAEREIFWIEKLNTFRGNNDKGMNLSTGGEGNPHKWMHDLERRKKASEYFTKNPPFKGRKHTAESKALLGAKISKINKAKGQTVPKWGAEKGAEICRKPIIAYNKEGVFVSEYISVSHAAKMLNVSRGDISSVLIGAQFFTKGIVFKYKIDNYPLIIDVSHISFRRECNSILLINEDKEVMRVYQSAKEASIELNTPEKNISRRALNYKGVNRKSGYTFVYQDVYEQQRNQLN